MDIYKLLIYHLVKHVMIYVDLWFRIAALFFFVFVFFLKKGNMKHYLVMAKYVKIMTYYFYFWNSILNFFMFKTIAYQINLFHFFLIIFV